MLGRNSRLNLWISKEAQLMVFVMTLQSPSFALGFVVALLQHFCHVFNVCLLSSLS